VPVNSKYADPLETPEPIEVAHVFSRLESQILAFVRDLVEVEAERGASSEQNLQLCSRLEKTRQEPISYPWDTSKTWSFCLRGSLLRRLTANCSRRLLTV
jgi:hypothetical protein